MKQKKSNFKIHISLVIYLFCFMFAPPILPINFIIPLSIYSLFIMMRFYRKELIYIIEKSKMKRFTILMSIYVLYLLLIIILNFSWGEKVNISVYITSFYQIFLITPIMLCCIIYIIIEYEKFNLTKDQLIVHFIWAGAIEAIISLCTFISPSVRQICIDIMNRNLDTEISDFILSVRVYGFANGLYDLFGWGTGIIAALPLFLSKDKQKKYMWFIPLLLVSPLLNARTGIVIFLLGFLIYLLFMDNKSVIFLFKKIFFIFVGICAVYLVIKWIQISNEKVYTWITKGIESFANTLSGGKEQKGTAMGNLFKESSWNIPSFPDIIFGTGHSVYVGRKYAKYSHSDVGYINYLWMGGIVGSCMLYGIYFVMFCRAIKQSLDKRINWLLIFLGGTIIVFNIKGQAFTHCPATAVILTILFCSIYDNVRRGENNEIYSDNTSL